jgi:hypothetical protein
MADDELARFEAMMGALSKSLAGDGAGEDDALAGARCPKCEASSFVRVSELYDDAVRRLDEPGGGAETARQGGRTDLQIVERLGPPRRRSALRTVLVVGVPLGAVAFYVYRRFGGTIGQGSIVLTLIATLIVFLTTVRRLSDDYYKKRNQWNRLFMCRRCGQLVSS